MLDDGDVLVDDALLDDDDVLVDDDVGEATSSCRFVQSSP